jgi:hypothetical protein
MPEHLLEEERVAARLVPERVGDLVGNGRVAERADQRGGVAGADAPERDALDRVLAAHVGDHVGQGLAPLCLAAGTEHEHRDLRGRAHHLA